MGDGQQFGGGWGGYDEVRFEHERYVFFEHGLTRIGQMDFATGSRNSVGICGIRVREE